MTRPPKALPRRVNPLSVKVIDNQTCKTCKWWGYKGSKDTVSLFACFRRPPVVVATGRIHNPCGLSNPGIRTEWPMVGAMDHCGEWEGKDDTGPDIRTIADMPPSHFPNLIDPEDVGERRRLIDKYRAYCGGREDYDKYPSDQCDNAGCDGSI